MWIRGWIARIRSLPFASGSGKALGGGTNMAISQTMSFLRTNHQVCFYSRCQTLFSEKEVDLFTDFPSYLGFPP